MVTNPMMDLIFVDIGMIEWRGTIRVVKKIKMREIEYSRSHQNSQDFQSFHHSIATERPPFNWLIYYWSFLLRNCFCLWVIFTLALKILRPTNVSQQKFPFSWIHKVISLDLWVKVFWIVTYLFLDMKNNDRHSCLGSVSTICR